MKLKSFGLSAFAATTLVAASLLASAPAKAISLGAGTFALDGESSVTNFFGTGDTEFTLNFRNFSFAPGNQTGAFAAVGGVPLVSSLDITGSNLTGFSSGGQTGFISGLTLGGRDVTVDLNPFDFTGTIIAADTYAFAGADLFATIRASDGSILASDVGLTAIDFVNNQADIGIKTVPTPALLPGLIGVGVAALRKRKRNGEELVQESA